MEKLIILVNTAFCFLRGIHKGHLSIEKGDNKQINFANELEKIDKGVKYLEKSISK